jgi:hypothetical protein
MSEYVINAERFNAAGSVVTNAVGPITTSVANANFVGGQWDDNMNWCVTWTCPTCGALVNSGQWHVCCQNLNQLNQLQSKPHRCPVCDGKGRVLFDPENPHGHHSAVQDWPCKPCGASGIVWGF